MYAKIFRGGRFMNKCCKKVKVLSLIAGIIAILAVALALVLNFALPYFKGALLGFFQGLGQSYANLFTKALPIAEYFMVILPILLAIIAIVWLIVFLVRRKPLGIAFFFETLVIALLASFGAFLFADIKVGSNEYNLFFAATKDNTKLLELILMIVYLVLTLGAIVLTIIAFAKAMNCKCGQKECECECCKAQEVAPEETKVAPQVQQAPATQSVQQAPAAQVTPTPVVVQAPPAQKASKPQPSLSSPDEEARAKAKKEADKKAEQTRKIEAKRLAALKKEQEDKKKAEEKAAQEKAKAEAEKKAQKEAKAKAEKQEAKKPVEKKKVEKKPATKKEAKPVEKKPAPKANEAEDEAKSSAKVYHVSQHKDGKWQVKAAKGEKALKLFDTQAEAIAYAKEVSKNQAASIRVHSLKGKIRKA